VAADVYSQPPYAGRGGWSWYTGSAAWMHRAAVESLFGLQLGPDTLYLAPGLPPHWPRAELTLRRDGRHLRFLLLRCEPAQALAQAAPWRCAQSPTLLLPGATLRWRALAMDACYVVPLSAASDLRSLSPVAAASPS
jgi:cyclic beta-1,2-glucan synthetase